MVAVTSVIVAVIAVLVAAASAWYSHSQVAEMRRQFEQSGPLIEVTTSTGIPVGLGTGPPSDWHHCDQTRDEGQQTSRAGASR